MFSPPWLRWLTTMKSPALRKQLLLSDNAMAIGRAISKQSRLQVMCLLAPPSSMVPEHHNNVSATFNMHCCHGIITQQTAHSPSAALSAIRECCIEQSRALSCCGI